jgi:hypothetical protein
MLKEELYINGERIELLESLDPNLTFNIADIAKPDQRKADFSKTINLPGSKKINKIFEHIFELGADLQTFNPNNKTDVIYLVNGEIAIDGFLRLMSINNTDGEIVYNCVIIGRVGNFIYDLQDSKLEDLDLSSLDHTYTKANQAATWNYPLTTDYVYPMINYDRNYAGLAFSENWDVEDFFPAIKAKKYIDAIFDEVGYSYTSNFFDSAFFNTLIIPFNSRDFKIGESGILNRIFIADTPQIQGTSNTYVNPTEYLGSINTFDDDDIKFTNEVYDAANVYNNTTGVFEIQAGKSGYYDINGMLQLQGEFTAPATGGPWRLASGIHGFIKVNKYDASNTFISTLDSQTFGITEDSSVTVVAGATITTPASPTTPSVNYYYPDQLAFSGDVFIPYPIGTSGQGVPYDLTNKNSICNKFYVSANNVYLEAGQKVKVVLEYAVRRQFPLISPDFWLSSTAGSTGNGYKLNILSGYLYNEMVNTNISDGNLISMSETTPRNIKQRDFIMSIIKMFNLYLQPDPDDKKNLIIEPRDDFYTTDVVDWSEKLDNSQSLESNPMGALNHKEYLYTYKQDKDYYNDLYFNTYAEVYGQEDFEIQNEFLKDEYKTEIIFSPTPNVGQEWYDRVIPTIIKFDDKNGVQRTESNIRILQWGGMKDTDQIWTHSDKSGSTTNYTNYPYAGMWDDPYSPTQVLEFDLSKEIYYSNVFNNIVTFTDNTLFNKYHLKFLQEIVDTNSKVVTGYFYLTPSDINNLSFKKQYYFGGQYFRLNKVENYNPRRPVTKCEFLKLKLSEVFTASTQASHGGTGLSVGNTTASLFSNSSAMMQNNNSIGNKDVQVVGKDNYVSRSAVGVKITGEGNQVFSQTKDIVINGNNNVVEAGCTNVELINTHNVTVSSSNVSYINGEANGSGSTELVTTTHTAEERVKMYLCNASSGSFSIDFEALITIGKVWTFKKISSSNQVTIDATPYNIDGNNTYTLGSAYDSVEIEWIGDEFLIISTK